VIFDPASFRTVSFWRHILLSRHTWHRFLEALGALFLFAEVLKFFSLYPIIAEGPRAFVVMVSTALLIGCTARFPVTRIKYRIPKKDYEFDVRIADLLSLPYDIVVSTNTTFDTDISGGLIASDSLQGQFTKRVFNGDTRSLDDKISASLDGKEFETIERAGKSRRYPLGTVAIVKTEKQNYYLLAMSNLNSSGNAQTSFSQLELILEGLWAEIANRGELGDVAVPVIGTGRGRLQQSRQKIVEVIAQSFADASRDRKIANKLIIVISPDDAKTYDVNLFQIRDYLTLSMTI